MYFWTKIPNWHCPLRHASALEVNFEEVQKENNRGNGKKKVIRQYPNIMHFQCIAQLAMLYSELEKHLQGCQLNVVVNARSWKSACTSIILYMRAWLQDSVPWEHGCGLRHALGSNLSDEMKLRIEQMHAIGLSPVQIMSSQKQEVRDMTMNNQPVTRDTFLLPSDDCNICRKRVAELWENMH